MVVHGIGRGGYAVTARYSNDGGPPFENVQFLLDGVSAGAFQAENTRVSGEPAGSGWNNFLATDNLGVVNVAGGTHTLEVDVSGGDGYGVEIDWVKLSPVE